MSAIGNPALKTGNPDNGQPREGYVPEESPGFDDDIELPLDVEDDLVIPDEERVIDVPS